MLRKQKCVEEGQMIRGRMFLLIHSNILTNEHANGDDGQDDVGDLKAIRDPVKHFKLEIVD